MSFIYLYYKETFLGSAKNKYRYRFEFIIDIEL